MLKPICCKCQRFFRVKKNGYRFIEAMPKPGERPKPGIEENEKWTPYKLWVGDLYECQGCGSQIVSGFGNAPISEHYMQDFKESVTFAEKATNDNRQLLQVNDC